MFINIINFLEVFFLMLMRFFWGFIGSGFLGVVWRLFFLDIKVLNKVLNKGRLWRICFFFCFSEEVLVMNFFKECLLLVVILCILVFILGREVVIVCKIFWIDGGWIKVFVKVWWRCKKIGYFCIIVILSFFKMLVRVLLRLFLWRFFIIILDGCVSFVKVIENFDMLSGSNGMFWNFLSLFIVGKCFVR